MGHVPAAAGGYAMVAAAPAVAAVERRTRAAYRHLVRGRDRPPCSEDHLAVMAARRRLRHL